MENLVNALKSRKVAAIKQSNLKFGFMRVKINERSGGLTPKTSKPTPSVKKVSSVGMSAIHWLGKFKRGSTFSEQGNRGCSEARWWSKRERNGPVKPITTVTKNGPILMHY